MDYSSSFFLNHIRYLCYDWILNYLLYALLTGLLHVHVPLHTEDGLQLSVIH